MSSTRSIATVPTPGTQAITLGAELSELESAALSPRTKAIYEAALRYTYSWLDERGLDMTDGALADYLGARFSGSVPSLTKPGTVLAPASPSTCALIVAAAQSESKLRGSPSPVGPRVTRTLGGIRRLGRTRGRGQRAGLSWRDVDVIVGVALQGEPDIRALRDVAALMVMSDALLRISELAAIETKHLTVEEDGTGRLHIETSKTDQTGEGATVFIRRVTMKVVDRYREMAGVDDGVLFRRMRRGSTVLVEGLSTVSVRAIIVRRAGAAGITTDVSGHSMRIGSAASIADAGGSLPDVMDSGRWRSATMAAHYCRRSDVARGAVARLRDDDPA